MKAYLEWAIKSEQTFRPDMIGRRADEDDEISALFDKTLADAQRGAPEQAMLKIQQLGIAQIFGWLCEHVGDLTHRMSQKPIFFEGGFRFVDEKVAKTNRTLRNGRDVADVRAQIGLSLDFFRDEGRPLPFPDEEAAVRELETRARAYTAAHSKLPVYNRVQRLARQAAVKLGEWDFDNASSSARLVSDPLDALARELQNEENWKAVSMTVENAPK